MKQQIRRTVLLLTLLSTCAATLLAVDLTIGYENKEIYVPGSEILIKFTLENDTAQTYRFKLAQNRMFNVDFTVTTLANQPLPPARQFITERTSNQQVFYRDITLEPGEQFSFVEDVSEYVQIEESGVYRIQATFYPGLIQPVGASPREDQQSMMRADNALSLTVRPPLDGPGLVRARIDERTQTILQREDLPPDEVVEYVIEALQDQAWNRFFLYTDVEELLLSDPARARSYRRLSEPARRDRLAEFRAQLEASLAEPELSAVPSEFEMVRTSYDHISGTVIMDLRFRSPTFVEIKRYTYSLRREDGVWYIDDYAVTNLGSESTR